MIDMTIKISKSTYLYTCMLLLIMVVVTHYCGFPGLSDDLEYILYVNRNKWIGAVSVVLALLCWRKKHNMISPYIGFIKKYYKLIILTLIFHMAYASIVYPLNSFWETYTYAADYLYVFLAIPILYLFIHDGSIDSFFKLASIVGLLLYFTSIIDGIFYLKTGNLFFSTIYNTEWTRNGKVRMGISNYFCSPMLIYHVYNLLRGHSRNRKRTAFSVIYVIFGAANIYFLGTSRMWLLALYSSIIALVIFNKNNRNNKICIFIMLMIAMTVFIFGGSAHSFISSFSVESIEGASTLVRLNAISFYMSKFRQNPFFAIGFADPSHYSSLTNGNLGVYFYDDVGLIGEFAKIGIFAVGVYIWPLIRYARISFYMVKKISVFPQGSLILALWVYLILTSFSLLISGASMGVLWAVLIAVFEYMNVKFKIVIGDWK